MRNSVLLVPIFMVLSACTSVTVRPVNPALGMRKVCIQENPAVRVDDFVPVLRDAFGRHHIATQVFSGTKPEECEYVLTYTALQSWDMSLYLSQAELKIEKDGREIAYAEYHLEGKGGLSLYKWASTKEKMDPVMDELLGGSGK